jgi:protein-S-isoprenylcysteine O-methyltransferase Ste14
MIPFGRTADQPAKSSDHHAGRLGSRGNEPSAGRLAVPLDQGLASSGIAELITTSRSRPTPAQRLFRVCANVVGAASAAVFSYSFLHFYLQSHRLIGIVFFAQQTLVALAYLSRRPARLVTRRLDDWLLAFAGTFIGVLFRPEGEHPAWGIWTGTILQLIGVAIVATCILTLGRSFGFAAADRGVVTRGPYALVRHPMYATYLLLESGYLLQSLSMRNAAVLVLGTLCNGGRALAEERLLVNNTNYRAYRRRVRRRIIPGLW